MFQKTVIQTLSVHNSDRCTIHPPTWWHRRHASAALLPLLPRWHRCYARWGTLLGGLEACAAVRVRLPTRAEEGGTQGWNGRHTGEQPRYHIDLKVEFKLFRSSPEKRWNEDDETMGWYEKR